MGRNELKHRSNLHTTIDIELSELLRKLSKNTDVPISRLIDRAVRELLESEYGKNNLK